MENMNNTQVEAELILINSDINSIVNDDKANRKLLENDINYIVKQRNIDSILLDKDQAKSNIETFRSRKNARLNGKKHEMYNSAS